MSGLPSHRSVLPLLGFLITAAGCAPSLEQREINAADAVKALQAGSFEDATEEAERVLAQDPSNPYAGVVLAVTTYEECIHDLAADIPTVFLGAVATGNFNQRYLEHALSKTADDLGRVDDLLRAASEEPDIAMELCPSCWDLDLSSGDLDLFDEALLEIEQDKDGRPLHKRDPRRRPTFRFDRGDVLWARAFVAFQRAAVELALAYDWKELGLMFEGGLMGHGRSDGPPERLRFELKSAERVRAARELILAGLEFSDRARRSYLSENDDDREWLPNPVQEDHPIPLPVDRQLYDTWAAMVDDLGALVRGEHVLVVADILKLGDHDEDGLPRGAIDIGVMFERPKDIEIDIEAMDELDELDETDNGEDTLKKIFGEYYLLDTEKPPSPIPERLERMKRDLIEERETVERKAKYLIWLN